jgi:NAD kinase
MTPITDKKLILVVRRSRLDELIYRFNTIEQARFYVEHLGADFSDYQREHDTYCDAIRSAETTMSTIGRVQVLQRDFLPNFIFGKDDTVVVLGQDGLVANTVKYLDGQPVIGVNPDPARWDGLLLPFTVEDLKTVVPETLVGMRPTSTVTMAKAELTDGQTLYAVNDLFIGGRTHVSARYRLQVGDEVENQSSSGIIVSTGLGSTGWMKSVVTGAATIAGIRRTKEYQPAPWDAEYLSFAVREPFPSNTTGNSVVYGKVHTGASLTVESQMPDYGVIFSDGVERDYLEFNSGMTAVIGVADKAGCLVEG